MFPPVRPLNGPTSLAFSGVAAVLDGAALVGLEVVSVLALVGEADPIRFRLELLLLAGVLNQTTAGLHPAHLFEGAVVVG